MQPGKLYFYILLTGFLISAFKSDSTSMGWGTKTTYTPLQLVYSPPPAGYEPVFINYVGRHGARFQTSITTDSLLYQTLSIAARENGLTPAGVNLKRMDSLLMDL